MSIANVPEHEYREHKGDARKGTNAFSRWFKAFPTLGNNRNIDQHAHNQQNEGRKNGVISPIDIPTPSVRNGQIIENEECDNQYGQRNPNNSKMPAANAQTLKNILHG